MRPGLAALEVVTLDRLQGAIDDALDRVFGLFDALAVIAVVIAALGIANTLTMNVMERVREIGILRAAGMTRRQVWRSVVVEAGHRRRRGRDCSGSLTGLVAGALMVVLAGGRLVLADAVPWADRRARRRPRRRPRDARGGVSGADRGADLHPECRRLRVSGC